MKMMRMAKVKVAAVVGVLVAGGLVPLWAQQGPATQPAGGTYGPVIQRTLNAKGTGREMILDLDTGRIIDPPVSMKGVYEGGSMAQWTKWAAESGADFIGEGTPWLVDAVMIPAPSSLWEEPPKEAIVRLLRELRAGTLSMMIPECDGKPVCYVFRTREGAIGVLRIAGRAPGQSEPPAWQVEYRLLEGAGIGARPAAGKD